MDQIINSTTGRSTAAPSSLLISLSFRALSERLPLFRDSLGEPQTFQLSSLLRGRYVRARDPLFQNVNNTLPKRGNCKRTSLISK